MSKVILYIHGFNSTGEGEKVQQLKKEFVNDVIISPTLSYEPKTAIKQLKDTLEHIWLNYGNDVIIVGTSLGGYYGLYLSFLYNIPVILLNPSIEPFNTLKRYLGTNTNYNTKESWIFTNGYLESLKDYKIPHSKLKQMQVSVFLDGSDEVINSYESFRYFSVANVSFLCMYGGGNHRFTHLNEVVNYIKTNF